MSWIPYAAAAVSAFSSLKQSGDQARLSNLNAQIFENNAASMRAWGLAEADRIRQEGIRQRGKFHAKAGASGVDVGTGSFLDVLSDDAIQNELDALDARFRGESGARVQEGEAAAHKFRASTIKSGRVLSALGSAFQGFALGRQVT